MEMFLKMREEDRIREELREEKREVAEREREIRHQQLIIQLTDTRPTVPQTVNVSQTRLPLMKESDEVEIFVNQLEIALKTGGIPRNKWKYNLTLSAKEPIERQGWVRRGEEALFSRKVTSHAAAAEAYYSFNNRELLDLPMTHIFTKLRRVGSQNGG